MATTETDPVAAGLRRAGRLGYYSDYDQSFIGSVLRVAESDEAEGRALWASTYPHDPTSFAVILGAVRDQALAQARGAAWRAEQDTCRVLEDVRRERVAQRERYGLNEHTQDGTGSAWLFPFAGPVPAGVIEQRLREDYLDYAAQAPVTWVHLLREEMAEAFAETDPVKLRAELVQVAALAVSWCERLDARRQASENPPCPECGSLKSNHVPGGSRSECKHFA